jgi:hypothetical protein
MSASSATTITVSQVTRKRLGSLKEGGQTYDQVIEELLAAHPNRMTLVRAEVRCDPRTVVDA